MKPSGRSREVVLVAWFREEYLPLLRVARVMLGNRSEAEEAVMDAFAKAAGRWQLFRSLEHPPSYLRGVVVNECRARLRRRRMEERFRHLFRRPEVTDAEAHADRIDVWRAIQTLPPSQRACIALRYLDDLSEREIASTLNLPAGTVKSQLSRARMKLQGVLGGEVR